MKKFTPQDIKDDYVADSLRQKEREKKMLTFITHFLRIK